MRNRNAITARDFFVLTGISLQAHPTGKQKLILSQWMGCARFIWNAKCDEQRYLSRFAKSYLPIGSYPKADQTFAQYKSKELSPWLYGCPSQILRNSAVNWFQTHQGFLKGRHGKPSRKTKSDAASVYLTRELFRFEKCADGVRRLFIGTKRNNIGYLSIKNHGDYQKPNSITVKRKNGRYWVSFCYEDGLSEEQLPTQVQHLEHLRGYTREQLQDCTIGIDRGVVRPVQAGDEVFDFSDLQKKKKKGKERYIRFCQRRLSRQKKGSYRRRRTKRKLAKSHEKIANIRKDFCHKTSRAIVDDKKAEVIIFEDLKTSQMTKKPAPKKAETGNRWLKNRRRAKAGLNRSILDKNWYQLELFVYYKAYRAGKAVFKVPAYHTSQECADCGHTHPNNRKKQDLFLCACCGYSENADRNAAEVIKKRAINCILDSGTELSKRGVLLDSGRGAAYKTQGALAPRARGSEASKKKETALVA